MAAAKWFVKLFNIRAEESRPVFYLMIFSFFVGLSMTFYFAASNAIFLKHFESRMISVSYIASGVIVWAAWLLLSRLDRHLSPGWQLIVKFLFVFVTVTAISTGVWLYDHSWLVFIMFTWVRILVYVTVVTFWGLAGKLFNIRQGKRIFALLGIGEVISIIIGYFSVPLLLQFLKASDLLFLSSGSLLVCLILVFVILKAFRTELSGSAPSPPGAHSKENADLSYWKLVKKPYFLFISLMALLPIFGYLFVDFLFLAQTKVEFANDTETIAGFFGIFLGFVAVIELVFKLVSGRFLNKYGLKPGLLSLPVVLFAGMLMAAVMASFYGTVGLFFAFISMVRLFERSVRSAVYEPAFQLLYQPVPAGHRLIFQNQIEGIPKASGTVITGAVILLFSTIHAFNLVHYSWIFVVVLALWIWVAFRMYDQYRNMLKTKLSELEAENGQPDDPVRELVIQCLSKATAGQFDQVYRILETVYPVQTEEAIPDAFIASPETNQVAILQKIRDRHLVSVLPFLKEYSGNRPTKEISSGIDATIREMEDQSRHTFENMVKLSHSLDAGDRRHAACMLGTSGKYNTYKLLISLMHDADPRVRRAALRSASQARRTEFWPSMIENLADRRFAISAKIALQQVGEPVLSDLDRFFEKSGGGLFTKKQIITIFEFVGGTGAIRFLRSKMAHPDKEVRTRALAALGRLGYRASVNESAGIRNMIEEVIGNILWVQASLLDINKVPNAGPLQMALLDQLEADKQEVFMLLSLLYDSRTMSHVMEHIESKDTNAKVYAFEIGDMLIGDELKQIVFPLFEDITMQERLQRLENKFLQEKMDPVDRMFDILNRDLSKTRPWMKAKAIGLLGEQRPDRGDEIKIMLASCLSHPHELIVELAARVLIKLDKPYFDQVLFRLKKNVPVNGKQCQARQDVAGREERLMKMNNDPLRINVADKSEAKDEDGDLPLHEKVMAIKNFDFFFDVPENVLIDWLVQHQDIRVEPDIAGGRPHPGAGGYTVSDAGYSISLTEESVYELVDSSVSFAKRYLSSISVNPQNEGL
ncbi:MAG: Npt1/Npt2 family nucleotide transporter [Mangrovibacterium sp.]|nr:Npt1/Npt2 family nucleotide transporter [Mangrovibacterium sp.]